MDGKMMKDHIDFATRLWALMYNYNGCSPLGRRVTQGELADALTNAGIPTNQNTIGGYLRSRAHPTVPRIKAITKFFGVSYEDLLDDNDTHIPAGYAALLDVLKADKGVALTRKTEDALRRYYGYGAGKE